MIRLEISRQNLYKQDYTNAYITQEDNRHTTEIDETELRIICKIIKEVR